MAEPIPPTLAEAFLTFCQGNFSFRLPRTMKRDEADTHAFFFNSVADELERIITESRDQEARLAAMTSMLSEVLIKVAAGDFSVQAPRDGKGDSVDVLIFLVNNTISELAHLVAERERAAEAEREKLERLVEERTAQLQASEARLRELSVTDELTGVCNRRRIFEVADELHASAERYGRTFSIAMLDLDRFKSINDTFGHAVGDAALKRACEVIRGQLRAPDVLGRYGGEELTVLFPETGLDAALAAAERIRLAVEREEFVQDGRRVPLALSGGVVSWSPGVPVSELVRRADAALYDAKSSGRNRVLPAR